MTPNKVWGTLESARKIRGTLPEAVALPETDIEQTKLPPLLTADRIVTAVLFCVGVGLLLYWNSNETALRGKAALQMVRYQDASIELQQLADNRLFFYFGCGALALAVISLIVNVAIPQIRRGR
ncbi:hypothetical protein SAMN05519103_04096 [Rhizobiales bacterium GAS113]|jgi:hypothetical protein|nr:hypothetical protein SAMN05519103_04096 [Rhizobiales bacterium GAS113]